MYGYPVVVQDQKKVSFMYFIPIFLQERDNSHFGVVHSNTPASLATRIGKIRHPRKDKHQTRSPVTKLTVSALIFVLHFRRND